MANDFVITTLTGKEITLPGADTDTVKDLKERLNDEEGIPIDQMLLHFPVPSDVEGSKLAQASLWFIKCKSQLDPTLSSAITRHPLKEYLNKATLGDIRSTQQQGSIPPSAYLTLQLMPPSKTITLRVEAQNFESKMVECDVESMTGAQLYAKLAEPQYAPDLKEGGKALVTLNGRRIKNDDTLLEDLGIRSEQYLYVVQELAWYPKAGEPIDQNLEDRLKSEIIKAQNGHKSELRSKRNGSSSCTVL